MFELSFDVDSAEFVYYVDCSRRANLFVVKFSWWFPRLQLTGVFFSTVPNLRARHEKMRDGIAPKIAKSRLLRVRVTVRISVRAVGKSVAGFFRVTFVQCAYVIFSTTTGRRTATIRAESHGWDFRKRDEEEGRPEVKLNNSHGASSRPTEARKRRRAEGDGVGVERRWKQKVFRSEIEHAAATPTFNGPFVYRTRSRLCLEFTRVRISLLNNLRRRRKSNHTTFVCLGAHAQTTRTRANTRARTHTHPLCRLLPYFVTRTEVDCVPKCWRNNYFLSDYVFVWTQRVT